MSSRQMYNSADQDLLKRMKAKALTLLRDDAEAGDEEVPSDHPSRWFEPITQAEYGSIEKIIEELQRLINHAGVQDGVLPIGVD